MALLVLAVLIIRPTIADPDLWGHLRFGLDTLELHSVCRADTYSYLTAGQRWINHEWLSEVLFALAYSATGAAGLNLLRLAAGFGTLAICYRWLSRRVENAVLLLLLVLPVIHYGLATVRPQLFTYLLFAIVLSALVLAEEGRWRRLWLLPALFALWANLHGGFLAGLAVVFVWGVVHLAWNRGADWQRIVPVCLLCALATLLNPYGAELPAFLLRTAVGPRADIGEWQPLRLLSVAGGVYTLLLALAVIGLLRSRRTRALPLVAVFAMLAPVPLVAVRHLPLFGLGVLMLAGEHMGDVGAKVLGRVKGAGVAAALPLVMAVVLGVVNFGNVTALRIGEGGLVYPAAAVASLKASGAVGNMVVPFDWGEYVIWHLGPRVKVSMDGRRETVYSDEVRRADLRFRFGEKDWDALLERPPADVALVVRHSAADKLMRLKPGWVLAYEDAVAAVFAPQGSALLQRLQQHPKPSLPADGNGLNFP